MSLDPMSGNLYGNPDAARLDSLRNTIRRATWLVYAAAGVGFVNFLFFEQPGVELAAVSVLILVPFFLDMLALSNRGHVCVDHDEGSPTPQIFSGTMAAGITLALMSLLDRGALIEPGLYEILLGAALVKGFVWYVIDADRIRGIASRGRLVVATTVGALFVMPAFWVGGSIYQINKLLDASPIVRHTTEVLHKKVSSGRTTSYTIMLAPWSGRLEGPVEVTLRRAEFEMMDAGMAVEVGVREGALGIAWVAAVSPDSR